MSEAKIPWVKKGKSTWASYKTEAFGHTAFIVVARDAVVNNPRPAGYYILIDRVYLTTKRTVAGAKRRAEEALRNLIPAEEGKEKS